MYLIAWRWPISRACLQRVTATGLTSVSTEGSPYCPTLLATCLPAVERTGDSQAPSPARLLVGSLHDDALLLCRPLALEKFPSPLMLRTRTRTPSGRGKAVEVKREGKGWVVIEASCMMLLLAR